MKIVVDENIPRRTTAALCALGHIVIDVRGTSDQGVPDESLWSRAQSERALILSTDRGFSRSWDSPGHHGILVIRLRQPNLSRIHERVMLALRDFSDHDWPGLAVEMRDTVRSVRRVPPAANDPQ